MNPENNFSNESDPNVAFWRVSEEGKGCSSWIRPFLGKKFLLKRTGENSWVSEDTGMGFVRKWIEPV